MLAPADVAPYLLRERRLTAAAVVAGGLTIEEVTRRNRNYKVVGGSSPSYLLKQGAGPEGAATIAHEHAIYRLLQRLPGGADLAPALPRCHGYDPRHDLLMLELVRAAPDLHAYHASRPTFPTGIAAAIGRILAALHRLPTARLPAVERARLRREPPWVFTLHRPGVGVLRAISAANLQLVRMLQFSPEFGQLLDELHAGWRADALIHYDVKWDNFLVAPRSAGSRSSPLKLVDWEFAGLGDPCWDAGAVFANYLSFWLFSIPVTGEEPPDHFLELARSPLARMQPALRAFWRAYARGMGFTGAVAVERLLRAIRYAAARLIQTGFEHMQHEAHLTGNLVCLLQLSFNVMRRPHEALAQLLGIPLPEGSAP